MLLVIAWFVWITIWGVIGWTSFMAIRERIKMKRDTDNMVKYWTHKRQMEQSMQAGMYKVINIDSIGEEVKPYGKES